MTGKNMKEKSTLANIFYNTFGSLFYYGCQWLTTILIVRLSGYEDAGYYSLAMTFTAAFGILALYNTRQFQASDVQGEYNDRTYIVSRYAAMALAFIICALGLLFNAYPVFQWLVILLYMVFKCGEAWADVYHGICQKNGRMDFICYSFLMRGALDFLCFCGVIYLTGNLLLGVLAMTAATCLVVFFYDRHMASKFVQAGEKADYKALKTLMVTLIPLVIVSVVNNLSVSIPKYFLERYFDATVLGYYSSVATPSLIVQVGALTIFTPLITPLADKLLANDKKGFGGILKKVFLAFAVLSVLAILASYLLGEWCLVLVFGEEIRPYTYLFVPIIISTLLISINACLFPVCTVFREIKGQLFVGIVGILSSLAASVFFVKRYCMDGVVTALFITLGIQIIIQVCLVYQRMRKWKEIGNG